MQRYCVPANTQIDLGQWDADDTGAFAGDKTAAKETLAALNKRLEDLQELLYAEHKHKLLIVLQAMDTGGKDSVIRHVFEGVNPQGVRVAGFKAPTSIELDHDYLWRIHQQTPGKGEMVIFNRSHYEDVLVVRVHNLVAPAVWERRYAQINDFERLLAEEGTTILKFYLHISQEEQKTRLQARLDTPHKRWKFNPGDLDERKLWPAYIQAYQAMLNRTSAAWAPWYIVPANHKWYRNLVIATVIVQALEGLNMQYPQPQTSLDDIVIV